jgi:hypothetical protein
MATASERFANLARQIQEEAGRALPPLEQIARESSDEDHERADRLTRQRPDMILSIGEQVGKLSGLVFTARDFFLNDRAHWNASPFSRNRFLVCLRVLCSCAWAWHQHSRVILSPELERVRAIIFCGGWHMYMAAALLIRSVEASIIDRGVDLTRLPASLLWCVQENSYVVHLLNAGRASFVVDTGPIAMYSVSAWKTTIDGLLEAIHRFGLTPSAARLLEALVYRYAAWLVHEDDDYADVNEDELNRVFSHWTLTRDAAAAPDDEGDSYVGPLPEDAPVPVLGDDVLPMNPRLRLSFVLQGEMLLFPYIRHMNAMRAFTTHPRAAPLVVAVQQRRESAKALVKFATDLLRDQTLASDMTETIKTLLMRRHLRPGEAALALFEAGARVGLAVEADEAMYDSRREEYNRINDRVIKVDATVLLAQWLADLDHSMSLPFSAAASDREWDNIAAQRSILERAAFLILETVLDTFLRVHRVRRERCSLVHFGYPDDAGLVPPLDAPPSTPEEACAAIAHNDCIPGAPLFIALAHVYAIVVPLSDNAQSIHRVLYTPHLVDAFVAWLAVCLQRKFIPPSARAVLKPLVSALEETTLVAQWK